METVIKPISRQAIQEELIPELFLRKSHFGNNEIYIVNFHNAPHIMMEIGRLRELAFRKAGGGTGKSIDIDNYDTNPDHAYEQLIIWDPSSQQILGGYRFILCSNALQNGTYNLATNDLFDFSESFKKDYLPFTIELGRSFVYHETSLGGSPRKSIFVLDNLWEGISSILARHTHIRYLFGKITMYLNYDKKARDYILYFMNKHFYDSEHLVTPKERVSYYLDEKTLAAIFPYDTIQDDYKVLFTKVRELKSNIPPLFNSYINISDTMKIFGTSLNKDFGAVEETGALVTVNDIKSARINQYRQS